MKLLLISIFLCLLIMVSAQPRDRWAHGQDHHQGDHPSRGGGGDRREEGVSGEDSYERNYGGGRGGMEGRREGERNERRGGGREGGRNEDRGGREGGRGERRGGGREGGRGGSREGGRGGNANTNYHAGNRSGSGIESNGNGMELYGGK